MTLAPGRSVLLGLCFLGLATGVASAASAPWKTYAEKADDWYRGSDGRRVAANILSHQAEAGDWPKNIDTSRAPSEQSRDAIQGTFDNGATVGELRFLARFARVTGDGAARAAFLKGLDHILRAQYPNGGWPQNAPPRKGYPRYITFNDGTMVHLLELVRDVGDTDPGDFAFVDDARRSSARRAFDAGIACILKCQIKEKGKLTVWCAQHDEKTLEPRPARTFEPASLSGGESAGILRLLMTLDRPGPEVRQAVEAGVAWFERSKITGIRETTVNGDKVIVADEDAPPLWARFYELETNRPIFSGRDAVIKYSIAEIEPERRNGYAWYGTWGRDLPRLHARWRAKWGAAVP